MYLENELARQFYAEMCRLERWSVRTLRDRVRSMMFERTAVSRLPEATIREDLQQQRMTIGNQDFYLDLLFYHRRLARLIAIDLKLGRFEAGYKGQMELYLRWLDQNERRAEHEEAPLGLILCSAKDEEQVELLQLIRAKSAWPSISLLCRPRTFSLPNCTTLSSASGNS